jgi:hypothetical protein
MCVLALLCLITVFSTIGCGFQQIRAENTTHPVLVGPIERFGTTANSTANDAGSIPVHVEYSEWIVAGGASKSVIPGSKMDALVLASLKSDQDIPRVQEISMKTYFLWLFPIIVGGNTDIDTEVKISRPPEGNQTTPRKGKGGK